MESAIKMEKIRIRNQMLQQRERMPRSKKIIYDKWVCERLWEAVKAHQVKTLHTYLPMGSEIDITPFIEKCLEKDLVVVVPKTLSKRRFENLILTSLCDLESGVFGTRYPSGNHIFQGTYDMIVVPGLACDGEGYRLGYGGGYYDTFLANQMKAFKIGIFYPFQKKENLPKEAHDIRLDKVVSKYPLEGKRIW
ncbi:5-formyltetrahydrofolate cyclo-ligase [Flagellimonas okinawensis]|uniref:5-formyltetrahydrofolate cyclo-ligase n=1 Tax=Flagellimonas okinawensis TaxID=3031324 RepID=A0ABT5XL80_9FLAO|nr:5-formyltetrahydrofolate cyclo-ligase [[Muricauda] okinawensis]MDF0706645.1 5-formyltetrahydrofolate cyclo-ligase [[Muricauda] okinawensis]